jgi:UPF0716 protein FxsA
MTKLFLLFTIIPVLEFYLLMKLASLLGVPATFLIVVGTGAVGAGLARKEGLRLLTQWHEATQAGRMPEEGVISGALLLVGGVLLVTPGVMTDVVGLLLLFPQTRLAIAALVRSAIEKKIRSGELFVNVQSNEFGANPFPFENKSGTGSRPVQGEYCEDGEILDGNIEIIEDDSRDDPSRNG